MTPEEYEPQALELARQRLEKRYQERLAQLAPPKEQKIRERSPAPELAPQSGRRPSPEMLRAVLDSPADQASKEREALKLQAEHAQELQNLADARGKSQGLTHNQIARDAMVGYEPTTVHPDNLSANFNTLTSPSNPAVGSLNVAFKDRSNPLPKAPERDPIGRDITKMAKFDERLPVQQRMLAEQRLLELRAREEERARERAQERDHSRDR
jgi:hypothetical protein